MQPNYQQPKSTKAIINRYNAMLNQLFEFPPCQTEDAQHNQMASHMEHHIANQMSPGAAALNGVQYHGSGYNHTVRHPITSASHSAYNPIPHPNWCYMSASAYSSPEINVQSCETPPWVLRQTKAPKNETTDYRYKALPPKPRYTAVEDLFIRCARTENISWDLVASVLKEQYQHADSRNSKNLQVHFSQKINPTIACIDELTSKEKTDLQKGLLERLDMFYTGVAKEFEHTSMKAVDPAYVQRFTEGWGARTQQELERNLQLARSMSKNKARKRRRTKSTALSHN